MKKVLILLATIFCVTTSYADVSNYNFPPILRFENQIWNLSGQEQSPRSISAEYVTGDESASNWTQLFTYQQMVNPLPPTVTPHDMANHVEQNLKQKDIHYTFKILSATDDEAIVEFQITEPTNLQQDELQRIIKTKKGIYIIMHYVTRQLDMGMHMRNTWIANLKSMPMILI